MIELFFKGLIIGFSIAAPVGPIGVLCINRSLHFGWKVGLATGLGAAGADGVYGLVAGFGLTFISHFLLNNAKWISLIGGIFLLYLGIKTLVSHPPKQRSIDEVKRPRLVTATATTFFLTLTNPMTILSFIAIFAGLGLGTATTYAEAIMMVLGIVFGSFLWWLLLSVGVAVFIRKKLNSATLHWVNISSGVIIILFGLVALGSKL